MGAVAANGIGLALLLIGLPVGVTLLFAGWMLLAFIDRRLLTLSVLFAVPITTFGWEVELFEISGRSLDIRLLVTFGASAICLAALALARPRTFVTPEWIFALLIGWAMFSGIIAADSHLTWGPPVARLVAYAAIFALARRQLTRAGDLQLVSSALAVAFVIPTAAGLLSYLLGSAEFINEAARAATPGGRGPISLAFAGQVALALAFALFAVAGRITLGPASWLAVALIGAGGLLASATRLVTVTCWLILAGFAMLRRKWRTAAVITLLFAAALLFRPDLIGRFVGTVGEPGPTQTQGSPSEPEDPDDEVELDASFRFRIFVWGAILEEWTERPLTGIGPGMTARVVADRSPAERAAPHNDYIGIFSELSVPGLGLYIALQALLIWGLITRVRSEGDRHRRDLMLMSALLFVGTNVLGSLNNPIYFFDMQVGLWALVGTALAAPPEGPRRLSSSSAG